MVDNLGVISVTNISIKWACVVLAVWICGCAISPPSEPSASDSALHCDNRGKSTFGYSDLGLKQREGVQPQVAGLTFAPDNSRLLIAYTFDAPNLPGELIQVQISNNHVLRSITPGHLTLGLTRFTEDTERIFSATPKICSDPRFSDKTCWDVLAWRTATGESVGMPEDTNTDLRDIAISGDGQWLLKAMLVNTITNFDRQPSGVSFVSNPEGVRREMVSGALSKSGTLVAQGIKDSTYDGRLVVGLVRLEQWDGKNIRWIGKEGWRIGPQDLTGDGLKLDGVPLRLAFDLSDRWLGAQTATSIYLFDVSSFGTPRGRVDFSPTTLGVLRFNPSGSLLAGGHTQGTRVLSVPDLKTVLDKPSAATTAIAFSPDGCLLAWGDMEGTVRIIPLPMR